jgi:hypothetical protein
MSSALTGARSPVIEAPPTPLAGLSLPSARRATPGAVAARYRRGPAVGDRIRPKEKKSL